jgi:hypothetical protein
MNVKVLFKAPKEMVNPIYGVSVKALVLAINRTIEEGQAAERSSMASNFIDRRSGFLNRMVKIAPGDRPTAANIVGNLRIIGPEGAEDRAAILTRHEDGGTRTTGGGYSDDLSTRIGGLFYIPTTVIRPQFSSIVARKLYPTNLRLVPRRDVVGTLKPKTRTTSSGRIVLEGDQRTFVLLGANGGAPIGIFQRKGGKRGKSAGKRATWHNSQRFDRDDIQEIWRFKPSINLKPRLHFFEVVPDTIRTRTPINFKGYLDPLLAGMTPRW